MLPIFPRRTDNYRAGGPHGQSPGLLWVPTVWAQRHLHPDITGLPGRQPPQVRGRQHATLRERAGLRGDDLIPPYTSHSGVYSVCTAVEVPYRYNLKVYDFLISREGPYRVVLSRCKPILFACEKNSPLTSFYVVCYLFQTWSRK